MSVSVLLYILEVLVQPNYNRYEEDLLNFKDNCKYKRFHYYLSINLEELLTNYNKPTIVISTQNVINIGCNF